MSTVTSEVLLLDSKLEEEKNYWRERLAHLSDVPLASLRTSYGARNAATNAAADQDAERPARGRLNYPLDRALCASAQRLSGGSPFLFYTLMLSGLKVSLWQRTGIARVAVGSPPLAPTETSADTQDAAPPNALTIVDEVRGEESFRELLLRVRQSLLEAYEHQRYPYSRLLKDLNAASRNGSNGHKQAKSNAAAAHEEKGSERLFELTLEMEGLHGELAETGAGVQLRLHSVSDNGQTPEAQAAEWAVEVEYASDEYERESIAGFIRQWREVLRQAVAEPNKRLYEVEMVSAAEKQQLLVEWNRTEREYPRDRCIHELFEQQAARTPDAIALEYEDEVISYAELNARANQLAHYLRGQGVSSESLVGVMMERSIEMVVALLGILKAGGAYLPLDAQYPQERLSFMLEDAGVSLLLIQDRFADRLLPDVADHTNEPSLSSSARRVISLDRQWAEVASHSSHNLTLPLTGDHLAYVIYTSGSTGLPKASAIPHRAVLRLVSNTDFAAFSSSEVFLQFAPISFDASTLELWGALLSGARLVLFPPTLPSLAQLGRFIRERRISTMWLTAGLFHQLVEHELEQLGGVRQLLAGGDVLSLPHVRRVRERWPQLRLINGYGPTENTTFTCCHTIGEQELRAEAVSVPIGRPIANTRVYVLDERMRPVPVGVAGELYAGGDGLARGYLGRVELTAERFVPDPFSERGGERLYRTGDVVRWSREGWIEFLGRRDTQVKVRGYRVELGEVEAMLGQHAEVAQCVVVVRSGAQTEIAREVGAADTAHAAETAHGASAPAVVSSREKQLVAYVVPQPEAQLSGEALRQWIGERLPAYLVPTAYVLLDELPLTANGKVDRAALPDPERAHQSLVGEERSLTPIEELMAGMWEEVLGIEGVGREDNFFALGGHSLAATQVVSRVRATLGVEVAVRAVFEQPTLAAFAAEVEQQRFSTTAGERAGDGAAEGAAESAADSVRWGQIVPVRRERGSGLPLSFAQQRLWFLDQLEPGSAAYNIPAAVRLRGRLNVSALERTLAEVVRRHEVLRTRFVVEAGQPVQVVEEEVSFRLEVIDLSEVAEEEREVEARRLAEVEAERPFDLSVGPLLRATLVRLSAEEQVVLLTMHHIISDGWSTGILIGEVARLYEAYAKGEESPLGELPIQYGDYAVWQREWLQGEVLEGQLGYWRKQLAGAPPVLELPTDYVRPAVQSFRGAFETFNLSPELSEQLKSLSRREGATLFMTLLAAFKVLLYRYTGQSDIVVGTPVANRNHHETEGLIGFFVNTLVTRTDLSGAPSFSELVRRVREMALAAYAHQDVPFERLVEELQPERDMAHTPLFQVMFDLENTPKDELKLPGLTLGAIEGETETAKFDLTLDLRERDGGLMGRLGYSTDLFKRETILRMLEHFRKLLDGIVSAPHESISLLPMLSEAERREQLVEWNRTRADYDLSRCVHQLFEQQAERTPDATAVVSEKQRLTYRELNQSANRLAHALLERGVGKNSYVPVLMERSAELVVALLGINKAGAAFVPLDVAWPQERIRHVLDRSNSSLVLVNRETEYTAGETACESLLVDAEGASEELPNPSTQIDPADPMYVIYTSGSTGNPKGVVVPHRGIVNRFLWMNDYFGSTSATSVVQTTSHVFDSAVWQFLWPLINGGQTVVPSHRKELTADYLTELIEEQQVTTVDFVPSIFNLIVPQVIADERLKDKFNSLRTVIVGGEEITPATTYEFLTHFPDVCVVNLYGPTEASIGCVCHRVTGEEGEKIPIGRPISNVSTLILDEAMNLVPRGVTGELYLSGVCLGIGYLNDEERTAASFVANPFAELNWDRLYKTGDLARYLPDGQIDLRGRADHQVKIRGLRIELGEIETALRQHASVRQAVVVAREDTPGDKRLVAYVSTAKDAETSPAALLGFLREKLPLYMIPSALMLLDELPLTAGGKVNRRALPSPFKSQLADEDASLASALTFAESSDGTEQATRKESSQLLAAHAASLSPVEEVLHAIWSEVLRTKKLGLDDDFFDLGGHSLLAVQVISRIRKIFRVEMKVRNLFAAPTIATFAKSIEAAMRAGAAQEEMPPIVPVSRDAALPLSFGQQRLWFLDQLEAGSAAYNLPFAVRLNGRLDVRALERSINEVVKRHEALRTTFGTRDGQPIQVIWEASEFSLPLIDLSELNEDEREAEARRLAEAEAAKPFNLFTGPLLRATLLRLSEEEHIALLTMHHIVSDGWSTGVLVREVAALYEAYAAGEESPLAPLPIQYADYAVWQRDWLQGEVLETQLSYWRKHLSGAPAYLDLPTDHPRPAVQSFRGAFETFNLSAELSEQLKNLSRREGATLFMTLLAAFKLLLSRYSGQSDIVVGTPVANRNQRETEELIGFFVNTLVLRTEVAGEQSFRELLGRVREAALSAYAHQDVPFERLVEELQPERDMSHTPLFQVMFVLQSAGREALELPGLTLNFISTETGGAKFDLTVSMEETETGLRGVVEYNTTLYEAATIRRMLSHFERLLEGCAENPARELASLQMLSEQEERQLLSEWNETRRVYTQQELALHQLFEQQVERTPDALALVSGEHSLSYRELDARSNQLARHLRTLGVGTDTAVGVLMERSLEMVVALLGILKAGGAYLPLDPQYPQERLAFMATDAKVPVLLTQHRLFDKLPAHGGARVVYLDDDWSEIARQSDEAPRYSVHPDQLAYVIYTSGSTGQPKGVMVSHRGIVNRLLWMQEAYELTAADRVLQKTPFSFDVSVWEFFWPLTTGARLVLARPGGHQDSGYLVEVIAQEGITVLHFVPPMLQIFLEESSLERCESVRLVVCSGEALGVELQRRFHERMDARLENLYGPTEASVDVTSWSSDPSAEPEVIPIGRPIANTRMYVLDERGEPVPVRVAGELYIAGTGLARGYLNRPDLTAERFIPDAFGTEGGARLYRTGDLARYLPDGHIEFLGRIDNQVKLRGNRIELGEIEAALAEQEGVREAVVIVREDVAGDKRLVAYLVAEAGASKDDERNGAGELRRRLKEKLPDYMIPSAFVELDELPLTANGKVDRRALPAPDASQQKTSAAAYVAPQTELERTLARIWQEVLRVETVGVADNFFDLGGHSLLLVQVQSKLRSELQREVSIMELFQYPSIESLAGHLSQQLNEPLSSQRGHDRGQSRKKLMARRKKSVSMAAAGKGDSSVSTH